MYIVQEFSAVQRKKKKDILSDFQNCRLSVTGTTVYVLKWRKKKPLCRHMMQTLCVSPKLRQTAEWASSTRTSQLSVVLLNSSASSHNRKQRCDRRDDNTVWPSWRKASQQRSDAGAGLCREDEIPESDAAVLTRFITGCGGAVIQGMKAPDINLSLSWRRHLSPDIPVEIHTMLPFVSLVFFIFCAAAACLFLPVRIKMEASGGMQPGPR